MGMLLVAVLFGAALISAIVFGAAWIRINYFPENQRWKFKLVLIRVSLIAIVPLGFVAFIFFSKINPPTDLNWPFQVAVTVGIIPGLATAIGWIGVECASAK